MNSECGFVLVEGDSEEQLINTTVYCYPFGIVEFVPISEVSKTIPAVLQRRKK